MHKIILVFKTLIFVYGLILFENKFYYDKKIRTVNSLRKTGNVDSEFRSHSSLRYFLFLRAPREKEKSVSFISEFIFDKPSFFLVLSV